MRKVLVTAAGLVFALACADSVTEPVANPPTPSFDQGGVPNDGNGDKEIVTFDIGFPVDCGGGIIDVTITGWLQIRTFGPNNRNVELLVAHVNSTYTNAAGETFVFRDRGVDRIWVASNGDIMLAQIGRLGFGVAAPVIGRIVINLTTQQVVSVSGRAIDNADEQACDVLT